MQTTLKASVRFDGVALHSGEPVHLCVHPAAADTGIVFDRTDLGGPLAGRRVAVEPAALIEATLCTRIGNAEGVTVSTIEHLMAALAGCGIHNARIELDGPEVPILDGSARPFVAAFVAVGTRSLGAPLRAIRVLRPVEVRMGEAWARLEPADRLSIAFEIDFPDAAIGHQQLELELCNGTFVRELSDCRTFCRQADVDFMRENGLALGGTYENAVVVAGPDVLSPGGLRRANEPVRHKMLDAMGDLAVAGAPILGRYVGHRAGHTLTGRLVRALLADPQAWDWVTVDGEQAHSLPGAGVCAEDLAPAA
ncbi:MAG: UDP-3-O-acyl-N-acetylglucosamine deacetylase [Rhodobacter sp.]|uniref:UDP-3-O-acyl-N-acetylglucosamine deacetylase n=1 Tax=Pararhodobacter sp. TaxID=2127056 RepID=UPI001DFF156E|nr:UDP-3-O-acyl-N-acetylglucosamine deacetylase [Pararhodobacter sp.]MCB1345571.1 UDP-3-O-acyl-N-acetylglucosamine deacetylase [Paracoccaceae bacterium]MCC0074551.1 UDP-3-O-acyl-N-acetylglucosamine deacetylase [Rhodobacter sp.]HPD91771.1 UDP-3-O-acyl-N-acetylglucosamine deacetylase [Pararhodobacter sp.]